MKKDPFKRLIHLGLGILILLIPFQFYFNFYKHLSISIAQLIAGVIFILWLVSLYKERDYSIKKAPLNLPIAIFILIMIASILISTNKPTSLKYTIKWVSLIMIYFIVVDNINGLKETRQLLNIIIASGVALGLIGIIEYLLGEEKMREFVITNRLSPLIFEPDTLKTKLASGGLNWFYTNPLRAFGTFVCITTYSAYLGLIIPLSISALVLIKRYRDPWWIILGNLLMPIAIILSFTRSAWLGMAASLFLMIVIGRKDLLKRTYLLTIIFFLLFMSPLNTHIKNRVLKTFDGRDIPLRLEVWKRACDLIKARPVLGVGVANYEDGVERFSSKEPIDMPAHSNYLQIGAEMGLLGLSAFVWIIIGGAISSFRIFKGSLNEEIRLLGLGFLGFWTWFILQSHFTTYYENDKFLMLFSLMAGLNMVLYRLASIDTRLIIRRSYG